MDKQEILKRLNEMIPAAQETVEQSGEWRDKHSVLAGALQGQIIALATSLENDIRRDEAEKLQFEFEREAV